MDSNWYQMWVTHKTADDLVAIIKYHDPLLQKLGSVPLAPRGTPIKSENGTVEIRSYGDISFRMTKRFLEDYGYTIEREIEHMD